MSVITPQEGESVDLGGLGVRFMTVGEGFSLVEHPIAPRTLAAPMHVHEHEDEYSYVLEGEVGVQIGDEVRYATAGDLVVKPRGIPHAFWNRTDEPARLLEIISPGGFERYFAELRAPAAAAGRGARLRSARRVAGALRAADGHELGGGDRGARGAGPPGMTPPTLRA